MVVSATTEQELFWVKLDTGNSEGILSVISTSIKYVDLYCRYGA